MLVEEVPLCFQSSKVDAFLFWLKGKQLLCFGSCPSQVTFGSLRGELQIPPNQRFPNGKISLYFFCVFKEFGTFWEGLRSLDIHQAESWN